MALQSGIRSLSRGFGMFAGGAVVVHSRFGPASGTRNQGPSPFFALAASARVPWYPEKCPTAFA
jgi:hypothetical protein